MITAERRVTFSQLGVLGKKKEKRRKGKEGKEESRGHMTCVSGFEKMKQCTDGRVGGGGYLGHSSSQPVQ